AGLGRGGLPGGRPGRRAGAAPGRTADGGRERGGRGEGPGQLHDQGDGRQRGGAGGHRGAAPGPGPLGGCGTDLSRGSGRDGMRRGVGRVLALAGLVAACAEEGVKPTVTVTAADTADQVLYKMEHMITTDGVRRTRVVSDTAYIYEPTQLSRLK